MAKINNPEVIRNLIRAAKINIQIDKIPNQLAEKVIPVIIAKSEPERLVQIKKAVASDATTATIHATHATKETYFVGLQISISKDAVSDSVATSIEIIPDGSAGINPITLRYEPTTAGEIHETLFSAFPIRLEKGSNITIANTTATASIDASGIVYFYEVDP